MHAGSRQDILLEKQLTQPNTQFVPQLDLLRTVAVSLVVVDHTALVLGRATLHGIPVGELGVTGVFLFFVHTALVLMWSLERKPYTLDFYIRRIFRIYPLAIAATLAVVATHAPLSLGALPYFTPFHITLGNLAVNLLLIFDLFNPSHGWRALLHVEWTLPWELQMYLVLPVLYAFVKRERTLWTLLLLWLLVVALDRRYMLTPLTFPGSIPNFLAGVIAFVGYKRWRPRVPAWVFPGFLLLAISALVTTSVYRYCWVFTLAIGLALPLFVSPTRSFLTDVTQWTARYSYGIYLAHPFAIWVAFLFVPGRSLLLAIGIELLVTVLISITTYHVLERPMIALGARIAARLEARASQQGSLRPL